MKKIIIVGKKNVGKSSLFNLLTKTKDSTIIDFNGYTRDCISKIIKLNNKVFELTDTAGIGYEKTYLDYKTVKHTWLKIKESDVILFMTDVNDLFNNIDLNILSIIKQLKKQVIYILNKIDIKMVQDDNFIHKFNPITISIKKNLGIKKLIIELEKNIETNDINNIQTKNILKISVIGRPNVGKSSLINKISNKNTLITDNLPGTTRDIIKLNVKIKDDIYNIIDTPGIKKKIQINSKIEKTILTKSLNIIKLTDISLLVLNINDNITYQDFNILNYIKNKNKNILVVLNKTDLIKKNDLKIFQNKINNYIKKNLEYVFTSAKYDFGIENLINFIRKIKSFYKKNIKENILNLELSFLKNNKIIRLNIIKYFPLTLMIKIKNITILSNYQKKYIISLIIKHLKLKSIPITIVLK